MSATISSYPGFTQQSGNANERALPAKMGAGGDPSQLKTRQARAEVLELFSSSNSRSENSPHDFPRARCGEISAPIELPLSPPTSATHWNNPFAVYRDAETFARPGAGHFSGVDGSSREIDPESMSWGDRACSSRLKRRAARLLRSSSSTPELGLRDSLKLEALNSQEEASIPTGSVEWMS